MATPKVVLDTKGLQRLRKEEPLKVGRWISRFAESVVTEIKLSFGESPSLPGEPPGVDTGTLRASMHWENTGSFERTISDGVEYGVWLEDVLNRPFMAPAFADAQKRIGPDARDNLGLEDV